MIRGACEAEAPAPEVEVVSTLGAGDAFMGTLVAGLALRDWDPARAGEALGPALDAAADGLHALGGARLGFSPPATEPHGRIMEATPTSPPPPPPPAPSAKRIEVGRVISETFDLYGKNAATLLGAAVVVFLIAGVVQAIFQDEGGFVLAVLASIVNLIANALYTGFVVNVVADVRADGRRDLTAGELFSSARPAIWRLIAAAIIAGIGIAIGFVLLIVPGLFLLTIWAVFAPAIVVEGRGVFESLGRSHELVRGDGWTVFGAIVVAYLIVFVVAAIVTAIGASISVAVLAILLVVFGILTAPVPALVSSILFFDLGGGADRARRRRIAARDLGAAARGRLTH